MANKTEVTIEIIAHATEDEKKILDSFCELLDVDKKEFSRQQLTGHFDNPITLLGAKITKNGAKNFVKRLVSKMPEYELDELIDDIENRIQGSTLHVRLAKQDLIKGDINLQEKDVVKLKIFTPSYNKKDIVKNYVALLKRSN